MKTKHLLLCALACSCVGVAGCKDWGKNGTTNQEIGSDSTSVSEQPPGRLGLRAASREEIVRAVWAGRAAEAPCGQKTLLVTLEELVDACPALARSISEEQRAKARARCSECPTAIPWTPAHWSLRPNDNVHAKAVVDSAPIRFSDITLTFVVEKRPYRITMESPFQAGARVYGYLRPSCCEMLE